MKHIAHYKSALPLVKCQAQFATLPFPDSYTFPPTLVRECHSCSLTHSFNRQQTYIVTTPRAERSFADFCTRIGITELDVDIVQQK
jgi:hypothetical protein